MPALATVLRGMSFVGVEERKAESRQGPTAKSTLRSCSMGILTSESTYGWGGSVKWDPQTHIGQQLILGAPWPNPIRSQDAEQDESWVWSGGALLCSH